MALPEKDGAAVRVPPPLVYLAAIVAGALLQKSLLRLSLGLPQSARIGAAIGAAVFGVGLMVVAAALFRRTGQDPKPWESTPEIVSTGPYRLTRNPMYLGMALVQGGIGLSLSNGWILLLLPIVLLVIYLTAIYHEEAYLERKFGDTYLAYKASVRRCL